MSELNARGEHAVWLLDALIDIYDDEQNNAPEDRCYVEGAWTALLADIRTFLRSPSNAGVAQPRFPMTYCSQCGCELGPGNAGVSSCKDHK